MATKKQFLNGGPAPVTPKSNEEKVQDLTPGQAILSEDQDYDENEHSDDIAAFKKLTELDDDGTSKKSKG